MGQSERYISVLMAKRQKTLRKAKMFRDSIANRAKIRLNFLTGYNKNSLNFAKKQS